MSVSLNQDPIQRKKFWQVVGYGITACVAISAGGYFFGISPAAAHLAERKADLEELASREQKSSETKADLIRARRRLEDAKREVSELPLRLEPASAVNLRLNRLAEVAASAGVNLNEMQPQPAIEAQHYQMVPIRVTGSGPYPACAAFLHALRTQFPDVAVQAFDAQNPSPGRSGNVANFRMELIWHTTKGRK